MTGQATSDPHLPAPFLGWWWAGFNVQVGLAGLPFPVYSRGFFDWGLTRRSLAVALLAARAGR